VKRSAVEFYSDDCKQHDEEQHEKFDLDQRRHRFQDALQYDLQTLPTNKTNKSNQNQITTNTNKTKI